MFIGSDRFRFELDETSALDVGSCLVDGVEIAPGDAVPDDGDARILHAVHGFLFTCGPDHIRHPEPIETIPGKTYPLHGSMSGHRPVVTGSGETDGVQWVTAKVTVNLAQGGVAEVARSWRMDLTTGEAALEDTVTNIGAAPFPPVLMYHMNVGAHLFGAETTFAGPSFESGKIGWRFGDGDGTVFCVPAVSEDGKATVRLGPIAAIGGKSLHVWFSAETLPHLQMWRNEAGHCKVIGIEPVSHPWKPRKALEEMGLLDQIAPEESRTYRIGFSFR